MRFMLFFFSMLLPVVAFADGTRFPGATLTTGTQDLTHTVNDNGKTPAPVITSVTPAGCVRSGDIINVTGSQFSSSNDRILMLDGTSGEVSLSFSSWTATAITASIPSHRILLPGSKFHLVISSKSTNAILSNRDYTISICSRQDIVGTEQTSANNSSSIEPTAENNTQSDGAAYDTTAKLIGSSLPSSPVAPQAMNDKGAARNIEPGEILVMSANMQEARKLQQQMTASGYSVVRRKNLKNLGMVLSAFRLPDGKDISNEISSLQSAIPGQWFDVNTRYSLSYEISDSYDRDYAYKLINWSRSHSCGENVRIGMLDSVVDLESKTLKQSNVTVKSVIATGASTRNTVHGTAIASLLVGNSSEFTGLLPSASLYAAEIFKKHDGTEISNAYYIVESLDWLASQKVHIINIGVSGRRNLMVQLAIQQLIDNGTIIVAPAGYADDLESGYPAAQDGVIAVTAIDASKEVYQKAGRGKYIDFSAPGVDIWNGQEVLSGISMATPFVVAVIAQQKPARNKNKQILKDLSKMVSDLGQNGRDEEYGMGILMASIACQ